MNIPLLYWATEVTGDDKYADIAERHFYTSCQYVIRDDASAFHTFYMDPETGGPVRGATRQGYNDESSWARGQAWGVYGIPLNYRYTHEDEVFPLHEGIEYSKYCNDTYR
ncbi:glycoside hydrolase family 88 protein [Erysipelothrix piscisicarius]|uniref:glycoside hydrolase family 88 protein n=1 Tax=Erysipelothrix piscisicarius TaxID=2485784 RepID=UPI002F95BC67